MIYRQVYCCLIVGAVALSTGCTDQGGPSSPTTSGAALSGSGSGSGSGGASAGAGGGTGTGAAPAPGASGSGTASASVAGLTAGAGSDSSGGIAGVSVLPLSASASRPVDSTVYVTGDTPVSRAGLGRGVVGGIVTPVLQGATGVPKNGTGGAIVDVNSTVLTPAQASVGTSGVAVNGLTGARSGTVVAPVIGGTSSRNGGLVNGLVGGVAR